MKPVSRVSITAAPKKFGLHGIGVELVPVKEEVHESVVTYVV